MNLSNSTSYVHLMKFFYSLIRKINQNYASTEQLPNFPLNANILPQIKHKHLLIWLSFNGNEKKHRFIKFKKFWNFSIAFKSKVRGKK